MFFRLVPVGLSISRSATSAYCRRRRLRGIKKKTRVFFFSLMKVVRRDEKYQICRSIALFLLAISSLTPGKEIISKVSSTYIISDVGMVLGRC
jgi:hypothetical protein